MDSVKLSASYPPYGKGRILDLNGQLVQSMGMVTVYQGTTRKLACLTVQTAGCEELEIALGLPDVPKLKEPWQFMARLRFEAARNRIMAPKVQAAREEINKSRARLFAPEA